MELRATPQRGVPEPERWCGGVGREHPVAESRPCDAWWRSHRGFLGSTMTASDAVSGRTCPQCGGFVPASEGFAEWCDRCGWGLQTPAPPDGQRRLARWSDAVNRRLGDRMARELLVAD